MYLFLLLLFPLAYCFFVQSKRFFSSAIALSIAALICAFRAFFVFRTPYTGVVLANYVLFSWLDLIVLPFVVFAVFSLFLRGSIVSRVSMFLCVALPFYAVYLPADVLSRSAPFSFFELFVKPSLYLAFLLVCAVLIKRIVVEFFQKKLLGAFCFGLLLLCLSIALPVIESLWYYGMVSSVWVMCAVLYVFIAVILVKVVQK